MKINVVTGENLYFAGKNLIQEIDDSDKNITHLVLVPDRFSLQIENLIMDEKKLLSTFNIEVLGLSRLANRVLKEFGLKGETLNSDDTLLLTEQAIQNVKHEFKSFKKTSISFAQEVSKVILQFKSSRLQPKDVVAKGCSIAIQNKYHDLGLIYQEYENLTTGLLDANKILKLFSQTILKEKILENTYLYLVGFDSFTSEMFEIISSLAKSSKGVFIALPKAKIQGNAYIYEDDILNKLTQLCSQENITIEVQEKSSVLQVGQTAIVEKMFASLANSIENQDYFMPIACQSLLQEVTTVCKIISNYVRQGGRFSDINIACSNLEKYLPYLQRCFSLFDIPYFADISISSQSLMLSNAVFTFLQVVASHFSNQSLLDFFSLPLNKNASLDRILKIIREKNIHKFSMLMKNLSHLAKEELTLFDNLSKANTCKDYCLMVENYIEFVIDEYNQILQELQEKYMVEYNLNVQALKNIIKALDSIKKYQAEYEISIQEFIKKLKLLLSFNQVSTVPTYVDSVMIGDATTSYFSENKILFVLGGGEALPTTVQDNGLVSDNEIANVNFIRKLEPSIRMINRRNRFKLFNLLSLGRDRLFVTYRTINSDGKKIELPNFIANLCEIFNVKPKSVNYLFRSFDNNDESFMFGLGSKKNAINDFVGGQKLDAFTSRQMASLSKTLNIELEKFNLERDQISGDMQDLFFPKNYTKVTQLERYFSCPFKHFVSYGLKLDESRQQELDARDIGNICHKCAELFVKQNLNNIKTLNDNDINEFLSNSLSEIFKSLNLFDAINESDDNIALKAYIFKQCQSVLEKICYEQKYSSFNPVYVEKNLEGLSLDVKNKNLALIGKVDRIDIFDDYFRIIDYKTGKVNPIIKDLYYGDKLQLFIYQQGVAKNIKLKPAGALYFDCKFDFTEDDNSEILKGLIENDDQVVSAYDNRLGVQEKSDLLSIGLRKQAKDGSSFKGSAIAKNGLAYLEEYAKRIASKAVEEILDGYILPKPDESACDKCQYKGICLYDDKKGVRKKGKVSEDDIDKIINGGNNGRI